MATMTQPPTDKEIAALLVRPFVLIDNDSFRQLRGWALKYKAVDYHWYGEQCGCDECGAYRRVGIG